MFKTAIPTYSRIRKLLLVKSGIVVEEGTEIGFGSFILGINRESPSVTFGKRVIVAPYIVFVASSYPDNSRLASHTDVKGQIQKNAPIVVGDDVWLGAKAVISPGVKIGSLSIVAAGAVVRQDVPPKSVVAGVPAKVIRILN
ncbi:MAG: acyltransferase [Desulfuromonadaceae bacterium]|nr:acyltransferase [Desulfuromonadaceae bacterium]